MAAFWELAVLALERAEFIALDIRHGIEGESLRADEGVDAEAGIPALLLELAAEVILHLRELRRGVPGGSEAGSGSAP